MNHRRPPEQDQTMQRKREENLTLLNIARTTESAASSHDNKICVDSGTALQHFLDAIPICSIPGITNSSSSSSAVEIRSGDGVGDAVRELSEKNVLGGLISDEPDAIIADDSVVKMMNTNPSNRYIGFVDFARLFLWSLQECGNQSLQISEEKNSGSEESFFSMLDQNPDVARTKIVALAKSFIWHPFLPVQLNDTLLHVLLLFSKHRPEFLPVVDQSGGNVLGFLTESQVIRLLLKSSGLEWFDQIADKPLQDFRFNEAELRAMYVFENQSIDEAIGTLWKNRDIGVVAVVQRGTKRLIGWVRRSDMHLLLDNHHLFHNRKSLSVEQFIHMSPEEEDKNHGIDGDDDALLLPMGSLTLRNNFQLKMDSPATGQKTDTLKQAMENLGKAKSSFCFLVDESQQLEGVFTLRDIMLQFAPPSMDSRISGGSFFETALEQTGCRIQNGMVVCDR